MKKYLKILALVVLSVLCVAAICACTDKPEDKVITVESVSKLDVTNDEVALVLKESDTEYTIKVVKLSELGENANGETLVQYLANGKEITVDWQESQYGKYINSYSGKTLADNEFVSVYTSVESDKGTDAYAKNITLGKYTVTTSAVGITSAKVEGGAVLYLQIESY